MGSVEKCGQVVDSVGEEKCDRSVTANFCEAEQCGFRNGLRGLSLGQFGHSIWIAAQTKVGPQALLLWIGDDVLAAVIGWGFGDQELGVEFGFVVGQAEEFVDGVFEADVIFRCVGISVG